MLKHILFRIISIFVIKSSEYFTEFYLRKSSSFQITGHGTNKNFEIKLRCISICNCFQFISRPRVNFMIVDELFSLRSTNSFLLGCLKTKVQSFISSRSCHIWDVIVTRNLLSQMFIRHNFNLPKTLSEHLLMGNL